MKVKLFTQMDAGEMREFLSKEYAEWQECEYKSPQWIGRFMRRVSILASIVGLSKNEVLSHVTNPEVS